MKNVIFLSPNFPESYWMFCNELKKNGMNVLGIGDCPYDNLDPRLKESLNEYYKVSSLENYDEVYRAVAFLIFKHGEISWLESNNEYWLERDAKLRTAFNITTGFMNDDIPAIKYKSKMKPFYEKAGIAVARYHLVDDFAGCKTFIDEVSYPVIVKPDNGVGASHTYRLENDDQLNAFLAEKEDNVVYIMEEFIDAEVNSYDAIIGPDGEPIFETGNITPESLMDVVNNQDDSIFCIRKELPEDMIKAGRATVKSFGVKNRFVHFEFFRLKRDQHIGKKDQVVALEVNMRPSGGISPDMMNYANSTNVFKIWADMVAFGKSTVPVGEHFFCAFVGRRDNKTYAMNHEAVMAKYGANMKLQQRVAAALSGAMGDVMYVANFKTEEEMKTYFSDLLA